MCRRDLPAGAVVCPHCQRDLNVGPWTIGFVLIWLVLAASAVQSYRQTAQLASSQALVDHTHRVLAGLQSIVGTLTDAETAQRGFIITGDERYLVQHQAAATALPQEVQAVRALLSDNPAQQQRLAEVERTARMRLETITRSLSERQRPDGFDRARAIVASGEGKQQMDAVRARVADMQRVEESLLEGREALAAQRFQIAVLSNLISTAVAVVMVGLVFMLVRRVLRVRQRSAFVVANERERYRITLASIGDAVIVTNSRGTLTFMNRVAEELTGWDHDAIGRPLEDVFRIINEQSRETVESPVAKVLREGLIVGLANHTLLVRRDGSEVPIDDSGAPIRDRAGEMTGVVLVFRDIGGRRRAERALQESEDRYRTLIEVSPQAVWMASPAGDITFTNQWWTDLTGLSPDQSLGDGWLQAVVADHRDRVARAWRTCIASGDTCNVEAPIRRSSDGMDRWHLIQGRAIKRDNGTIERWTGVAIDVHEERMARDALVGSLDHEREVAARLQRVAAASLTINASHSLTSIAGVLAGEARTLIPCHQAFGSIVVNDDWENALTASALSEKHAAIRDRDVKPARVDPQVWQRRKPIRLTELERTANDAWWIPDHDALRPALRGWLAVPLLGRDGRILGAVQLSDREDERDFSGDDEAVLQQLANLASIAIENSRLYDALRDADRRKDEFLAMLSHELRNPLAPIRNALHMLRLRTRGDAVLEQTSEMMMRQVDHMVRLVDDLLDVSRITRGKIALQREVVDASTIVNRAVEASRPAIEASRHALTVTFANQPLPVDVDLTRMAQVVTNLLNNAAKFTPEWGRIEIRTARKNGDAAIEVTDNGAGVPADVLPVIFDLFVQSGRTLDGSQGGLGIGLTLVKRLTEMHGGSVTAASDGSGNGSTFTVRLPLAATKAPTEDDLAVEATSNGPSARRLRVMVVDDNRDSADSLRMLLAALGNDAKTAYDGQRALELAVELHPELIILDIGLPAMSGYDVVKQMRVMPEANNAVIVALTGYGSESDRHRSAEAGFDDHLVKPVDIKRLEELLARTRRYLTDQQ
jgi:PAS domain S-box-containing protein